MAAYKMAFTNYANNNAAFTDLLTASTALKNAELAVAQAERTRAVRTTRWRRRWAGNLFDGMQD